MVGVNKNLKFVYVSYYHYHFICAYLFLTSVLIYQFETVVMRTNICVRTFPLGTLTLHIVPLHSIIKSFSPLAGIMANTSGHHTSRQLTIIPITARDAWDWRILYRGMSSHHGSQGI